MTWPATPSVLFLQFNTTEVLHPILWMLWYHTMPRILDWPHSPIYHQDGAPSHRSVDVRRNMGTKLPYGWNERGSLNASLPTSRDLTSLDFFRSCIWKLFSRFQMQSLSHVKKGVETAIAALIIETWHRVWKNLKSRTDQIITVYCRQKWTTLNINKTC